MNARFMEAGQMIASEDRRNDGIAAMTSWANELKTWPIEQQRAFLLEQIGSALGEEDLDTILDMMFDYYPVCDDSTFPDMSHLRSK